MNLFHYKFKFTMSGNSSDDKNDFNYQQELSRFLHTRYQWAAELWL